MAAGALPKPGTQYGPCTTPCEHRDCAATRTQAASTCRLCEKPIGYDVDMYRDTWLDGLNDHRFVHARCLDAEIDAERGQPWKDDPRVMPPKPRRAPAPPTTPRTDR